MKKKPTRRAAVESEMNAASQRPHKTRTGSLSRKPTERLLTRRSKNKHDGYFPNPSNAASQRPHKTRTGSLSRKPTERLKLRRAKNNHDGYFPNPLEDHGNYVVSYASEKTPLDDDGWHLATFSAQDEAVAYARWWAQNNPKYYVAVNYVDR